MHTDIHKGYVCGRHMSALFIYRDIPNWVCKVEHSYFYSGLHVHYFEDAGKNVTGEFLPIEQGLVGPLNCEILEKVVDTLLEPA